MDKIRYGVVGAGWISQIAFMPAVAQTGNSTITAIVSGSPGAAKALADFHNVPHVYTYDDYDAMLASDVVDAVYIALPNSMHADYAIRAARAGKHLLVEKPLATTVAECEAMIAAAEEAGVWLMTAYRLHHEPGTIEVLERIRAGAIGEPKVFTSLFVFQSDPNNHRLRAEHWGGPLQDIGIYCINAARHAFEAEPVEVIAFGGHGNGDPRFKEVEETIAATLRFPNERFAHIMASFGTDAVDTYRVTGTTGDITVDPGFDFRTHVAFSLQQNGEAVSKWTADSCDHFGAQTAYFSDCILNGTRPVADGEEGLADVAIMRAIEEAMRSGQSQKVDLPPRPEHPSKTTLRQIPRTDRRLVL